MYRVIYDAINDVSDAMKGMLAPKIREVALGEAQVRQVYKISSVGTVAGCRVTSGKITRDAQLRLVRDGIVICEDAIASLKRFKYDAKEVAEGFGVRYHAAEVLRHQGGRRFRVLQTRGIPRLTVTHTGAGASRSGRLTR